jgi:hypothetical protein
VVGALSVGLEAHGGRFSIGHGLSVRRRLRNIDPDRIVPIALGKIPFLFVFQNAGDNAGGGESRATSEAQSHDGPLPLT